MPSIQIPSPVCSDLHPDFHGDESTKEVNDYIAEAVKNLIVGAIDSGLTPVEPPFEEAPGITRNITFPAKQDREIRRLVNEKGVRYGTAVKWFLYAALARGDASEYRRQPKEDSPLLPYLRAIKFDPRHHQTIFFNSLRESLGDGKIGIIEAATGVGKTLAMVAAAAETLKTARFGRAVIATPTLQMLAQFVRQHKALEKDIPDMPLARVVIGRQEFLCKADLESVLDEGKENVDPEQIREWLTAGAPPAGDGEVLGHDYLLSSLKAISPGFPVEAVRLNTATPKDDPGARAYEMQFMVDPEHKGTEIIYCSHTMVAIDARRRLIEISRSEDAKKCKADTAEMLKQDDLKKEEIKKVFAQRDEVLGGLAREAAHEMGSLPAWQYLLVDEAHIFETNVANVLGSNLSLFSYHSTINRLRDAGILSRNAAQRVDEAFKILQGMPSKNDAAIDLMNTTDRQVHTSRAALSEMADAFASAKIANSMKETASPNNALLVVAMRAAEGIRGALRIASKADMTSRVSLEFTPKRAYPLLRYGRKSVSRELNFIWSLATSAACVSATLYLRKADADSCQFMAGILSVPDNRLQSFPVIRPQWTYAPVAGLWTPTPVKVGGRYWLRPPSRADKLDAKGLQAAESAWLDELAEEIVRIRETAAGGTLVLMTSYDSVKGVAERIGARIDEKVVAHRDHTMADQLALFAEYALAGRKPIWLAVGGAWTGLDVNGANYGIDDPAKDNLLTDLVIPRIPFAGNKSITHMYRMEILSDAPWELLDTSLRFKQGLGRLIRREGLPKNRRIFVLDGRVNDPGFGGYFSIITRIMAAYPAQVWERH